MIAPTMKTVVGYHSNCQDGLGAAWAAYTSLGDSAEYVPLTHGQPPPEALRAAERLYILDFSYPLETLQSLAGGAAFITVIDHHKSAAEAWGRFGNDIGESVIFDMTRSGALLAWRYFQPVSGVPVILRYVQDRDLWTWTLPGSRAVSAALFSYPPTLQEFGRLAEALEKDVSWAISEGNAILRYQAQQVDRHVAAATLEMLRFPRQDGQRIVEDHFTVPVLNATTLQSEIGHALCEKYPDSPFSATWMIRADGKKVWSLRSIGTFDVSEVAKARGGGGHPNSAGFEE